MLGQQWTIYTLWHFVSLTVLSCSCRVVAVHLACLACTTIQRWDPPVRVLRKSQFSLGNSCASCPLVFHEVGREAFCNWCSTSYGSSSHQSFLLPLWASVLAKTKSPGSSETALTFLIIVPLLSLCLRCGLHLSLFKGLSQLFTQLSNVVVKHTGVYVYPLLWRNRSWWVRIVRPKHQIMWAVSGDGWSCGVVSMHQLGQMLWPVHLPVLT